MISSVRILRTLAVALVASPLAAHAGDRDGAHDFDFDFGRWNVHMQRLENPLTGSRNWFEMDGTVDVKKIWDGKANLAEVEADGGPKGHLEILALRLYDPQAHQWSINFAGSSVGTFGVPLVGTFKDGRGEFYDQEPYNGRVIWIRFAMFPTGANSARSEQAFSADDGKTWEINWINTYTRDETQKASTN